MSRLARNIIYNFIGQSLILAFGLVAVRLVFRELGGDAVGILYFALTLNAVFTAVLDLGISATLVREIAHTGSPHMLERLLRTASLFYWAAYACCSLAVALAAPRVVSDWLNLTTLELPAATHSFTLLMVAALLALPRSLYSGLFRGLQRMGTSNAIEVATALAQHGGIAVIVVAGGTLGHVAWWVLAAGLGGIVAYMIAASSIVPRRALLPGLDRSVIAANRAYAGRMMGISILAVIHTHTDKLLASHLLPVGLFGMYAFAFGLLNRAMLGVGAVAQAALPRFSELHTAGSTGQLRLEYRNLQHAVSFVMIGVLASAPFAAVPVMRLVFGPADLGNTAAIWSLLALGFYLNATLTVPYMVSLAVGRPDIALALNLWAVLVVLPATVMLVGLMGVVGAALAWVAYHVFAYWYAVPRLTRECTGERARDWYADVARYLGPGVVIYGALWSATASVLGTSAVALASGYVVATLGYALWGWNALPLEARLSVRRAIARRWPSSDPA